MNNLLKKKKKKKKQRKWAFAHFLIKKSSILPNFPN